MAILVDGFLPDTLDTNFCHKCGERFPKNLTVYLEFTEYMWSSDYKKGMTICLQCYKKMFIGKGKKPDFTGGFFL